MLYDLLPNLLITVDNMVSRSVQCRIVLILRLSLLRCPRYVSILRKSFLAILKDLLSLKDIFKCFL